MWLEVLELETCLKGQGWETKNEKARGLLLMSIKIVLSDFITTYHFLFVLQAAKAAFHIFLGSQHIKN